MEIVLPTYKDQIAIVVVGYNRLKSISRLLKSLLSAKYPELPVPLVISIDCSGDEQLYDYVKALHWPYGEKYVNIQQQRLGLKNHIYQCGDLSKYFKGLILLEDDLIVSPYFYQYALQTVDKYGDLDEVAEISLYSNDSNGYAGYPFTPMANGADVYLAQDVSTWGQIWTHSMWEKFVYWRDNICSEDIIQNTDMPSRIKGWTRAWSKYYNAYVVSTHRYVVYPYVSLSTNFSDAGEHGGDSNGAVQVGILHGDKSYWLPGISELIKYDIFDNNLSLAKWLGCKEEELCADLYGIHKNIDNRRFLLSSRILPYKVVKSFSLSMRPLEVNVMYGIEGGGLFLYDTSVPEKCKTEGSYSKPFINYMIHGMEPHNIWRYVRQLVLKTAKKKLGLK